ncbi:MAG: PA2779 family protein [Pseudomonadota bacterium]
MNRYVRSTALVLTMAMCNAAMLSSAQAALVSTEQIAAQAMPLSGGHARLNAALDRADLQEALQQRGIDVNQARARVAALTDAEAAQLADQIDQAPAGASDVLGVALFVFVLLLVTDILGFTKVFPFTRSVR